MISRFVYWLVRSSKDSANWSLFLKSAVTYIITVLVFLGIPTEGLEGAWGTTVDALELLVQALVGLVGAYGLWRKLVRTWRGENAVLNERVWE